MTRYVHLFADPPASQAKELLGGKGAGLAEMTRLGIPVPPGLTITTEACRAVTAAAGAWPDSLRPEVLAALATVEQVARRALRRHGAAAAALGPLGRAGVDARHDGHHPERGSQRRDGGGARREHGRSALRLRRVPALSHDVRRRRARHRSAPLRGAPLGAQARARQPLDARSRGARRGARDARRSAQGARARRDGQALPGGPARAALGRRRRRLRELEQQARVDLPPHVQLPGRLGHGGERAVHGLRQHGRRLRHRRRVHAQSLDGRAPALRRVPAQRAGRGRRRGHPHAAPGRRRGLAARA